MAKNRYKRVEKVFSISLGARCREFESPHSDHVGASFVSLAPTFLQKSERTHAAAHPFQITTAALGCDLVSPLRGVF